MKEHTVAQNPDGGGNVKALQAKAAAESINVDGVQRFGERDLSQQNAAHKGSVTDKFYIFRHFYGLQVGAGGKCPLFDPCHRVGNDNVHKGRILAEYVLADLGDGKSVYGVGNDHGFHLARVAYDTHAVLVNLNGSEERVCKLLFLLLTAQNGKQGVPVDLSAIGEDRVQRSGVYAKRFGDHAGERLVGLSERPVEGLDHIALEFGILRAVILGQRKRTRNGGGQYHDGHHGGDQHDLESALLAERHGSVRSGDDLLIDLAK